MVASKRPRRWNSTRERSPSMPGRVPPQDGRRGHRVHPADEQREPLSGRGVGAHEVRGRVEAKGVGGLADALGSQVVPSARRQMGGPVAHPPDDAVGQQAGQGSVDSRVGLAEDARQLRRVDERHPAEGVKHLSFGEGHASPPVGNGPNVPLSTGKAAYVMPCRPLCRSHLVVEANGFLVRTAETMGGRVVTLLSTKDTNCLVGRYENGFNQRLLQPANASAAAARRRRLDRSSCPATTRPPSRGDLDGVPAAWPAS